jgi:hypothetical protein
MISENLEAGAGLQPLPLNFRQGSNYQLYEGECAMRDSNDVDSSGLRNKNYSPHADALLPPDGHLGFLPALRLGQRAQDAGPALKTRAINYAR